MPLATIKREASRSKAQHGDSLRVAFQEIRELIVHGRLAPGNWIVEADIAKKLGMSRTPVRGAIQLLQREGYVVGHRNRSKSRSMVAPLTREDAAELYSIIAAIEGLAGRQTALLGKASRMEIAARLRDLNNQLRTISKEKSAHHTSIFDLDREFHQIIVQTGGGPRLLALHRSIVPQAERYWRLYASSIMSNLYFSVAEHDAIIAAIASGHADRVECGLKTNWRNGCDRLAEVIKAFGERGSW